MVSGSAPQVVDVEVRRAEGLSVRWSDGLTASFGLVELRRDCPCATCRTWRDRGEEAWPRGGAPAELTVTDAELVGGWGISFVWNDGHGTGIYPWESLRRWAEERGAPAAP